MNYFKYILLLTGVIFSINLIAQRSHFSGGNGYSVFICEDNTVMSWGDPYAGQLGRTNTNCNNITPCKIDTLKNIISIDAGLGHHCLALTNTNKVLSWGQNFYGELGAGEICDGSPSSLCQRLYADTVKGGETGTTYLENVKAVSTGLVQSYALLNSGEVVAWGSNSFGQLGDGSTSNRSEPVYVRLNASTKMNNIKMISAGGTHIYALTNDGTVYSWGSNNSNQLGIGDNASQIYPQKIVDINNTVVSNVKKISAGNSFGLLLLENGRVLGIGAYKGANVDPSSSTFIYTTHKYAEQISGGEFIELLTLRFSTFLGFSTILYV